MIIIICICQLVTKNLQEVMSKSRILSRVFIAFWHKNKDNIWFGAHFAFGLRWFSCKQKIKDIELLRWKWSRLFCWKIQGSFSSQIEDSCENLNAIQIHTNTKIFSKQKNVLLWNPWICSKLSRNDEYIFHIFPNLEDFLVLLGEKDPWHWNPIALTQNLSIDIFENGLFKETFVPSQTCPPEIPFQF